MAKFFSEFRLDKENVQTGRNELHRLKVAKKLVITSRLQDLQVKSEKLEYEDKC